MSTRLLHLADVHLDRSFASMGCQGELARRRRLGLRDALRRAGDLALERGCLAVTIGGDLYESERSGADTAAFLCETFASWRPMRVLIAPGNHDALLAGSIYSRTPWPANVHIFSRDRLQPFALVDGLTVWGLAHPQPAWQGDPLELAEPPGDGGVHLALFHGAELGCLPDGKSVHGPFRVADVRRRGFAAALCGHYHRRRADAAGGLLYPGSPEPLTFDETAPRGPVVVEVAPSGGVSFEPVANNRWHARTAACEVGGATSLTAVLDRACAGAAETLAAVDPEKTMLRIDLVGELEGSVAVDTFTVESYLRDTTEVAAVRVRDLTHPSLDLEAVLGESTVRGAFARSALAAAKEADGDGERQLNDDALRYGLQALSGVEVGLR